MKKRSKGKGKKGLIPGLIVAAAFVLGLILVGGISSGLLRTILTAAMIAGIVITLLIVLLVVFANKAGQESPAPKASLNRASALTQEQSDSLKKASSQLTRVRMAISRFSDQDLGRAGVQACNSIEKVLKTLKEKPEKIQTTRQLFNYYLPTMEQVVERYRKLEISGVDNPEIPGNVRKYFDDITLAMQSQYEGLFDNDKLGVAVDMEAMTIALKRDGLLDEEDFKAEKKKQTAGAAAQAVQEQHLEGMKEHVL